MVNRIPGLTMLFGQLLLFFLIQSPMASAAEPSAPSTSSPDDVCDVFPTWPGCGITKCQRWKTCGPCTGIPCADWDEDRDGGTNFITIGEKHIAPPNNVVTPSMQGRTGTDPGSGRLRRGVHRQAPAPAAASEQRDHRTESVQTIRDHRKQPDRANTIVKVGDETSKTPSGAIGIISPNNRAVAPDHHIVSPNNRIIPPTGKPTTSLDCLVGSEKLRRAGYEDIVVNECEGPEYTYTARLGASIVRAHMDAHSGTLRITYLGIADPR